MIIKLHSGYLLLDWFNFSFVHFFLQHNCCPIHVASQGKLEIVEMLLAAKCDVNVRDDVSMTYYVIDFFVLWRHIFHLIFILTSYNQSVCAWKFWMVFAIFYIRIPRVKFPYQIFSFPCVCSTFVYTFISQLCSINLYLDVQFKLTISQLKCFFFCSARQLSDTSRCNEGACRYITTTHPSGIHSRRSGQGRPYDRKLAGFSDIFRMFGQLSH